MHNTETHTERQTDRHAYRHTHALHALSRGVVKRQIWERRSARGRPLLTYNSQWKAVICTVSDKTSCGKKPSDDERLRCTAITDELFLGQMKSKGVTCPNSLISSREFLSNGGRNSPMWPCLDYENDIAVCYSVQASGLIMWWTHNTTITVTVCLLIHK